MPEAAVQPDLVLECSEAFEPASPAPSPGRRPTAHTIKAHSALLILASPYFRRVLAGSTPEMPVSSVQVRHSSLLDPAASGVSMEVAVGQQLFTQFRSATQQAHVSCTDHMSPYTCAAAHCHHGNPQVESSRRAWGLILSRLMPVYPRPALSVDAAWLMLPLAAKYEMRAVTAEVMTFLGNQLPLMPSPHPTPTLSSVSLEDSAEDLLLDAQRVGAGSIRYAHLCQQAHVRPFSFCLPACLPACLPTCLPAKQGCPSQRSCTWKSFARCAWPRSETWRLMGRQAEGEGAHMRLLAQVSIAY